MQTLLVVDNFIYTSYTFTQCQNVTTVYLVFVLGSLLHDNDLVGHLENREQDQGNMARKITLLKGAIYSILFFLFIIFYVKDLMIDFAKGRSTMTSRYQKVETCQTSPCSGARTQRRKNFLASS